ncbi:MAG: hypothetical protein GX605_04595 [Chloroflexi bacterium]|nr:hypothetical protein [Chloroflexota bacterium]
MVCASHSGLGQALALWAQSRGWRLLGLPTAEQLSGGGSDWLAQLDGPQGAPLALPSLERCYLRSSAGLVLVRGLLQRLESGPPRLLIGCDSWAWAFLGQTLATDCCRSHGPCKPCTKKGWNVGSAAWRSAPVAE